MEFSFSNLSLVVGQMTTYPDWAFSVLPKQPGDIKETVILGGTAGETTISIGATADQPE